MSMISKLALFLVVLSISVQGKTGMGINTTLEETLEEKKKTTIWQKVKENPVMATVVIVVIIGSIVGISFIIYFALKGGKKVCLPKPATFSTQQYKDCIAKEKEECSAECQWGDDFSICAPKASLLATPGDYLMAEVTTCISKSREACKDACKLKEHFKCTGADCKLEDENEMEQNEEKIKKGGKICQLKDNTTDKTGTIAAICKKNNELVQTFAADKEKCKGAAGTDLCQLKEAAE